LKKTMFFFITFLIFINNNKITSSGITQNFSFASGLSLNSLLILEPSYQEPKYIEYHVLVHLTIKFDYLFFKEVRNNYKIGFGLALGDSINVSAMGGYGGIGTYITSAILLSGLLPGFIYTFFQQRCFMNRLFQKITFVNLIGSDYENKYALIEVGLNAEFVFFFYEFQFFISPNFFIGFLKYTTSWMFLNVKGEIINISHIIGGFFEFGINVTPYRNYDNFFINIGVEYRIGSIQ